MPPHILTNYHLTNSASQIFSLILAVFKYSNGICSIIYIYIYKYKEKLVILQLIEIIVLKSKETKVITYTCRYSSENLIPS